MSDERCVRGVGADFAVFKLRPQFVMVTVKLSGTEMPPFAVPLITMTGEPAGGKFEVEGVEELEPEVVQPTSVPATPVKSSTIPA